jgi:hypothetical protein
MSDHEMTGYTVAYARDDAPFPVYLALTFAAILMVAGLYQGNPIFFALGCIAAGFAYYNWPLAEIGRPRIGANQYGIFIEGFGIVQWRAIDAIDLAQIAVRAETKNELQVKLKQPLSRALIADWRKVPVYRKLMRLPWSMTYDNKIRISLDALEKEPDEIHRTFLRMWKHFRS